MPPWNFGAAVSRHVDDDGAMDSAPELAGLPIVMPCMPRLPGHPEGVESASLAAGMKAPPVASRTLQYRTVPVYESFVWVSNNQVSH